MRVLAVDCVCIKDGKIILELRSHEPFENHWVLPGGHVEKGEDIYKAVKREMKEELGISVELKGILGIYSDPDRDPRQTISVAFWGTTNDKPISKEESYEIRLVDPKEALNLKLGFDHKKIIEDYIEKVLKGKDNYIKL